MLNEIYQRVVKKRPEAVVPGLGQGWQSVLWTHENVEATDGEGKPAWAAFTDDVAESLIVAHWLSLLPHGYFLGQIFGGGYEVVKFEINWQFDQCHNPMWLWASGKPPTALQALAAYLEKK